MTFSLFILGKCRRECRDIYVKGKAWSHADGKGRVKAVTGDYHDAIFNKRSLVVLFHMEITGALSPLARKHLRRLKLRANRDDRTEYGNRAFPTAHMPPGRKTPLGPFVSHWTNRLSSAAVTGNARRASSAMEALAAMPPPGGHARLSARPPCDTNDRAPGPHVHV